MKVEIWSDFACPFCYIGKRRFEAALEQFANQAEVEVVYRSFELDPTAEKEPKQDVHAMLAAKYGMSREQAKQMNDNVANQAKAVGLTYHMDSVVPANTFDAHRLAQFAADRGKGEDMTERLLKAYFTDAVNLSDHQALISLAAEVGLDPEETSAMLASDEYADQVRRDQQEAAALGIRGVPFFVIDRKYGVSGAQPTEVFSQALEKAWSERQ